MSLLLLGAGGPGTVAAVNLVFNPGFESAPGSNVAQTGTSAWIDGTAGGTLTPTAFRWASIAQNGSSTSMFDSANPHSGTYGMKLSTTATSSMQTVSNVRIGGDSPTYAIPVLPSTAYTLTYWMKTVANSGSAATGANVQATERNGSNTVVGTTATTGITGTTGWTQYTLNFTTTSTTAYLTPKLQVIGNDGSSTLIMDAWFDDITVALT